MLARVLERDGQSSSALSGRQIALAQTLLMSGKFEESELLARASLALRENRFAADWKKLLAGMADGATAPSRPKQPE
jgi:hypothetical protein